MTYIDGFVIAVPTANKQEFIDHATSADSLFLERGALRVIECWGDDVPDGKLTDYRRAVQAKDDETVVFSWIEWPDKATRDAVHAEMAEWMQDPEKADPRMHPEKNPMPFDGKRMIFGGFTPVLEIPQQRAATLQPYLFFRGRCEEAITYYRDKLGAEIVMMLRFKDNPDKAADAGPPPELDERIMHATLRIMGADIMMSDGWKSGPLDFQCMSISLSLPDNEQAERLFDALAADGTVQMPMSETFFARRFGSVSDKFGVSWMLMVE